ncbi:DinB family protein [Aquirufa regiilacus]
MPTSQHLQAAYIEARTRLSKVTETLTPTDLLKKLGTAPNSIGFLLQHIAEVELLFCKNVFGHTEVKVIAHTVIDQKDTGAWTDLTAIQNQLAESGQTIASIMASVAEEDWSTQITTKEFGTKTKAEAFGRIISHTAYHAGQVAMIQKYGS